MTQVVDTQQLLKIYSKSDWILSSGERSQFFFPWSLRFMKKSDFGMQRNILFQFSSNVSFDTENGRAFDSLLFSEFVIPV